MNSMRDNDSPPTDGRDPSSRPADEASHGANHTPDLAHLLAEEHRRLYDYVLRVAGNPDTPEEEDGPLIGAVTRLHRELRRIQGQLKGAESQLARRREPSPDAGADPLTGLANRSAVLLALQRELERAGRFGTSLALALVDIERFREINRAAGQQAGDALLRQLADLLRHLTRAVDTVGRYGNDVYAVVLPNETLAGALAAANRWRRTIIEQAFHVPDLSTPVSVTVGIVGYPEDNVGAAEDMLRAAEAALEFAKASRERTVAAFRDLSQDRAPDLQTRQIEDLAHQVRDLLHRSRSACLDSIWAMVRAIEARDGYTGRHSLNVHRLAVLLARYQNLSAPQIETLAHAAMLHDIGKIGIPDTILTQAGPLSAEQWQVIRTHPAVGCRILSQAAFLRGTVPAIRHHHEHYDGRGYPDGLAGAAIPKAARILNLTDAFDAMTNRRIYRPAMDPDDAIAEIRRCQGSQFDPDVADCFAQLYAGGDLDRPVDPPFSQKAT